MVRTLLFSFLDTLAQDKEREKHNPSLNTGTSYKTFWSNFTFMIFYLEELILTFTTSYNTDLDFGVTPSKKYADMTYIQDFRSSLLEVAQTDGSLYSFVKKGLFFTKKNVWQDT